MYVVHISGQKQFVSSARLGFDHNGLSWMSGATRFVNASHLIHLPQYLCENNNLGLVLLLLGEFECSRALLTESLSILGELKGGIVDWPLTVLGLLAHAQSQPERAVRLLAAADVLRDRRVAASAAPASGARWTAPWLRCAPGWARRATTPRGAQDRR